MYKKIAIVIVLIMLISPVLRAHSSRAADTPAFSCDAADALVIAFPASESIVLAKKENTPLPVAGLTRMAAMLMVSEAIDAGTFSLDSTVTVSANAAHVPGPTAFLDANEQISARDLYKSAVMISAGDATYAMCEAVFGSMDVCLAKLNDRMRELEVDAAFTAPLGDAMPMTASDVAKIACALAASKTFISFSNIYMDTLIHSHNAKETQLVNPNRLIRDLVGCTGLMTGSSTDAGYCGAFSVTRAKSTFICVVLGAQNSAARFEMAKTAIEYAFASYKTVPIAEKGTVMFAQTPVAGAIQRKVDLVALDELILLCDKADATPKAVYNLPEKLSAPLVAGEIIGTVDYFDANGNRLGSLEVGVKEDVAAVKFPDYVTLVMCAWNG